MFLYTPEGYFVEVTLLYTPVWYLSSGFSFFATRMFYEGGSPIVLSVSLFRNLLAKYNL